MAENITYLCEECRKPAGIGTMIQGNNQFMICTGKNGCLNLPIVEIRSDLLHLIRLNLVPDDNQSFQ